MSWREQAFCNEQCVGQTRQHAALHAEAHQMTTRGHCSQMGPSMYSLSRRWVVPSFSVPSTLRRPAEDVMFTARRVHVSQGTD